VASHIMVRCSAADTNSAQQANIRWIRQVYFCVGDCQAGYIARLCMPPRWLRTDCC